MDQLHRIQLNTVEQSSCAEERKKNSMRNSIFSNVLLSNIIIIVVFSQTCTPTLGANEIASSEQEQVENKQVLVDWPVLPTPFNDEYLPRRSGGNDVRCYSFFGCIERLPTFVSPLEPKALETEFIIADRLRSTKVPYERTEICSEPTKACQTYPYDLKALFDSPFSHDRRTIIIIGGYYSPKNCSWQCQVTDVWLQLDDVNVIRVTWTGGNQGLYNHAAANTRILSRQVTVLLYYLAELYGLKMDDGWTERIYIVGHSLGAHAAGFVGQDFDGKLGRITGLDPAGPSFNTANSRFRLDRSDAMFVDAMHTNAGASIFTEALYGTEIDSGHIDFFANDGKHQPSCANDRLGCSHKLATGYYYSFIKHAFDISRIYGPDNSIHRHTSYRFLAYGGGSFEEFKYGRSLADLCPITSLGGSDIRSPDLPKCSIPIDYVAWPDDYRKELTEKYNLSLSNSNRYYFLTSADLPDQNDHYLLRITIRKDEQGNAAAAQGCDLGVRIEMADGTNSRFSINQYKLLEYGSDQYEMVIPFIAPNSFTKFELSRLDFNKYFEKDSDQMEKLRRSLSRILPSSVVVSGLTDKPKPKEVNEEKPEKGGGIMGLIGSLFERARGVVVKKSKYNCDVNIESLSVQVMKLMHRHQAAYYSFEKEPTPSIVLIDDLYNYTNASVQLKIDDQRPGLNGIARFYINKIILGAYIDGIEPADIAEDEQEIVENSHPIPATLDSEVEMWFAVVMGSILVLMLVGVMSWRIGPRRQDDGYERRLVEVDGDFNLEVKV